MRIEEVTDKSGAENLLLTQKINIYVFSLCLFWRGRWNGKLKNWENINITLDQTRLRAMGSAKQICLWSSWFVSSEARPSYKENTKTAGCCWGNFQFRVIGQYFWYKQGHSLSSTRKYWLRGNVNFNLSRQDEGWDHAGWRGLDVDYVNDVRRGDGSKAVIIEYWVLTISLRAARQWGQPCQV